jgi:putative methyltransferase (TIGR04325 family)
MHGDYSSWAEAVARCTGYDADNILAKVLDATLKVKRGEAAFERDSVVFAEIEYSWPVLAALMWAAARNHGDLSVLDFGGALGTSYFQNRRFLQGLKSVRWNVVEQPHYVRAGRSELLDGTLRFYDSTEECLLAESPNAFLLSGVLQCIPDPKGLLATLLRTGCETVILDRTCYVNEGRRERIRIQHVPESIYAASYPCRFLVEEDILSMFRTAGYVLVERFPALDKLDPSATWKGHFFRKEDPR